MAYATLPQVKAAISLTGVDTADDVQLTLALTAAEDMIDGYCGRTFAVAGTATATRVYAADACDLVYVEDATTVSLVETYNGSAWVAWDADDWQAEPLNGRAGGYAWPTTSLRAVGSYAFPTCARADVRVTATWGWPSVPDPVAQATIQSAIKLWKRFDTPLGFGGGPETGMLYVSRQVDGDVAQLLAPFRIGTNAIGGIA